MAGADFIKVRCTNGDAVCDSCGRDLVIPISSIEGVYRTLDDKAEICISSCHYIIDPRCLVPGGRGGNRIIKTEMLWADLLNELDGKVSDCGNITMTGL